jgi:antirestriction protein ArdC
VKKQIDIYQEVTGKIVTALEAGVRPWKKSWLSDSGGSYPLRHNGERYRGINVLILGLSGYSNAYWLTYKQAVEYGGQVRKGETGTRITFFKPLKIEDRATKEEKTIPLLRSYTVFNAEQIDGLPARYYPQPKAPGEVRNQDQRDAELDAFITRTGIKVVHGGNRAFYRVDGDVVHLPAFEDFDGGDAYYATHFHEQAHWTGHASRLDRTFGQRFGDHVYAQEELVAEIGAAFLCATLEVTNEPREDHAQYLATWLTELKGDKKAIFKAAAAAQKAADFILEAAASSTQIEEAA